METHCSHDLSKLAWMVRTINQPVKSQPSEPHLDDRRAATDRTPESSNALDAGTDAKHFLHPPVEAVRIAQQLLKALHMRQAPLTGQLNPVSGIFSGLSWTDVCDLGDEPLLFALKVGPAVERFGRATAARGRVDIDRRRDDEGCESRATIHLCVWLAGKEVDRLG